MNAFETHPIYEAGASHDEDALEILRLNPVASGESRAQLTGTKALMLAVFDDGIRCYLNGPRLAQAEAEDWLNSHRRYSPFAFVVLCETFGLDPHAVRATVQRMKEEHRAPGEILPRVRNNVRVPGRVCLRKRRRHRRAGRPHSRVAANSALG